MTEFEVAVTWRYTPDPDDYRDGADRWYQATPEEALSIDLENLRQGPAQYIPSDGVEVTGRVVYATTEGQLDLGWLPCGCLYNEVCTGGFHRMECEHKGAQQGHRNGCRSLDCHPQLAEMPLCWTEKDRALIDKIEEELRRASH